MEIGSKTSFYNNSLAKIFIVQMSNTQAEFNEKSPFSRSRYRNEVQIESLYNEFQSLKSQIYGFEDQTGLRSSQRNKETFYKDKATLFLQSSTIRKYELELASHLESIHKNKDLCQSRKKDKSSKICQRSSVRKKNSGKSYQFSKILSQNQSVRVVDKYKDHSTAKKQQNLAEISKDLQKSEALFYQLISDSSKIMQKSKKEKISLDELQLLFQEFSNGYLEMMSRVDGTLKYLNQKLKCLQLVLEESSKIKKIEKEIKAKNVRNQKKMVIDMERIEKMYENQIKSLTDFYERKNKDLELSFKENIVNIQNEAEHSAKIHNDAQKATLKSLLQKTKEVISTKQELILSLQEENQQLRGEISRLKSQIEKDVKLGYSSTANKIQAEMALISEIKKKVNPVQIGQIEEDDINFSELGSIKDNESVSEWDPLDLEHSRIEKKSVKEESPDVKLRYKE